MKITEIEAETKFEQIMNKNGWDLLIYKTIYGYTAEVTGLGPNSCILDSTVRFTSKVFPTKNEAIISIARNIEKYEL